MNAKVEIIMNECQRAASLVDPPINPLLIFKGNLWDDQYLVSRIRAIIGMRLRKQGIRVYEISKLFRQPWNTTHGQIRKAHRFLMEPRFSKFADQ